MTHSPFPQGTQTQMGVMRASAGVGLIEKDDLMEETQELINEL